MNPIESAVRQWLDSVVIGLNLCPFAGRPAREGRVRVCVSEAADDLALLTELQFELQKLDETPPAQLETTIIAIPQLFADFADYNDFLDQVASFHPQYQFAGTMPGDAENLTNRAPYPLLHLLREDSVEAALDSHPDPDRIPEDNIRKMQSLTPEQRRQLFGYLPGE